MRSHFLWSFLQRQSRFSLFFATTFKLVYKYLNYCLIRDNQQTFFTSHSRKKIVLIQKGIIHALAQKTFFDIFRVSISSAHFVYVQGSLRRRAALFQNIIQVLLLCMQQFLFVHVKRFSLLCFIVYISLTSYYIYHAGATLLDAGD